MPMNLATLSCPQSSGFCQIHQLQTWAGLRLKKFMLGTQSSLISVLMMKYSDKKRNLGENRFMPTSKFSLPSVFLCGKSRQELKAASHGTCRRRENKLLTCTWLYFPAFIQFRKSRLGMMPLTLGCILPHHLRQPRQSPEMCPQADLLQTIPH